MADHLNLLTTTIQKKLHVLRVSPPSFGVLRALLDVVYLASLRTEEGHFVKGSVTFADPKSAHLDRPIIKRAHYPSFTHFGSAEALAPESLVKLCRAIDQWSGSIAVYGTNRKNLAAWGVLDQLVQRNTRMNHELGGGHGPPGILLIETDGVGELSAYHGNLFLGGLRPGRVVGAENEIIYSEIVARRIVPSIRPIAASIARVLGRSTDKAAAVRDVFRIWAETVARLCIGVRRARTGGAFVIVPYGQAEDVVGGRADVEVGHPFRYGRLSEAAFLQVLESTYLQRVERIVFESKQTVDRDLMREESWARADEHDREIELTGAVKLVSSLAAVDGAVVLDTRLNVLGFGAKLTSGTPCGQVYDGAEFERRGQDAELVDCSRFGTRHGSMLRYCRAHPRAIGIVVSQDGQVRLILTVRGRLVLWDDVKLLAYGKDLRATARDKEKLRKAKHVHRNEFSLGYTGTPKTLEDLMKKRRNVER